MTQATAQLLEQRSYGALTFSMGHAGPQVLREVGASKLRLPHGTTQAIMINTGGGLAGGDRFDYSFSCSERASITLTSQAAERVYRTLGPPAKISTRMNVAEEGQLYWLPQETILYDGASLVRSYDVTLASSAKFLSVESVVFGRAKSGEKLDHIQLKDRWRIWRNDKLIHADDIVIGPDLPTSNATLSDTRAMATVVYIADNAESQLDIMQNFCACSAWNGKLIARFVAMDGYALRKALIPAINALGGSEFLPKIWTA
jgi:urease accessory protein